MQLCFDATRFGLGLMEAVEFAAAKGIPAVEFTFQPFEAAGKTAKLSEQEKSHLKEVSQRARSSGVAIACIRLDALVDITDKREGKQFQQMMAKLALVAGTIGCGKLSFSLKPGSTDNWIADAANAMNPVMEKL